MKIIFMGTPDFSVPLLSGLAEAGHEIACVVTQPDRAKNRGKRVQFTPVKERASELGIPVMQPERIKGNEVFLEAMKKYQLDIAVVVAYGQLLPKEVLELPRFGCINVHASLLPRLRGASPIQRAIVDGEEKTGVTIMQMAEGLDTGDMLAKVETSVERKNYEELHDELSIMGARLLLETLPLIEAGNITREKQDDNLSTYAGMIYKADGKIDFSKDSKVIDRLIRGFDPWPGAFCSYDDVTIKLWSAEPLDTKSDILPGTILRVSGDGFEVACGKGTLLVKEIQIPGKKRVLVKDYLLGHKIEVGKVLR